MVGNGKTNPGSGKAVAGLDMYKICLQHSRADRNLRAAVVRRLEKFDVTMMEWLLLGTVKGGAKTGLTMSEAAAGLDVTLPQITALSASLIKAKLLRAKTSPNDRRSRRLALTPAGKKLFDELEQAADGAMNEWMDGIPSEQLDVYLKTVEKLARSEH